VTSFRLRMANGRFLLYYARTRLDDAYSCWVADADVDVATMKLNRVVLLCLGSLLITLIIVTADSDSDDSSSDSSDSESDDSDDHHHPGSVIVAVQLQPFSSFGGSGLSRPSVCLGCLFCLSVCYPTIYGSYVGDT